MERGVARGWPCAGFSAAIPSPGAEWTWCPVPPSFPVKVQTRVRRRFLKIQAARPVRERAQGNVDGNPLVAGGDPLPGGHRGVVADL